MAHRQRQHHERVAKLTVHEFIRFRLPSIPVPAVLAAGSGPGSAGSGPGSAGSGPGAAGSGPGSAGSALDAEFAEIALRVSAAARPLDAVKDSAALSRGVDLYAGLKRAFRGYGFPAATNATLKMHEIIIQMGLIDCASGGCARSAMPSCRAPSSWR